MKKLFVGFLILLHFCFFIESGISKDKKIKTFSLPLNNQKNKTNLIINKYSSLRPKIGLALSGGGARGVAHIGVLKVFVENQIPIDFIVGTSMGSVVGGLFASGFTPDEIWQFTKNINWSDIIQDQPPRMSLFLSQKEVRKRNLLSVRLKNFKPYIPPAYSPGQKLYTELSDLILNAPYQSIHDFNDLKIPFRAIATDLVSGKKIVFLQGDLAQVMLASSAIPLLFSPVVIDSLLLVDGGTTDNIPVAELQNENVDLKIAVDVTSPLRAQREILLPWQLADQVTTIMQENQKKLAREMADIVITPKLSYRTNTDFDSLENAYLAGIRAARKILPEIRSAMQKSAQALRQTRNRIWHVSSVDVTCADSSLFAKIIHTDKKIWPEFDVLSTLRNIYATGYVKNLYADILRKPDATFLLRFFIEPFPILTRISFHHNHLLSDSLIFSRLKCKSGKRFNLKKWQGDRERIIRLFRKEGFAKAKIKSEKMDMINGVLSVNIDEGMICSIELIGNKKTKSFVILREYPLKKGDFFKKELAQIGIKNIYSSDFFYRVQPEYVWHNDKLDIKVNVVEKPSILFNFSYNYTRDDRLQTKFQCIENNILGLGNRLIISNIIGKRRILGQIRLQSDRIFKSYLSSTLDLFYFKRKHYVFKQGNIFGEFHERRSGFHASIGQQLRRIGLISLQLRLEQIALNPVFGYGYPVTLINRTSFRLQSIVDSLDKLPFPTHGRLHHFYYEMSSELPGKKTSFFKIYSSMESYFTFFRRITIHPKLVWATADLTTPFQEMYLLGGENSFYGYRMDEKRGRRLFQSNLEFRYFLPSRLPVETYFSLRYDFGTIWENSLAEINLRDFVHGYGGSLAFNSVLGVFSASYGRNSEGRKDYYFTFGFDF